MPSLVNPHNAPLLFDCIMQNYQDIITVLDLDYNLLTCNSAFLDFIHFDNKASALNKNIKELLTPKTADLIIKHLDCVIKTKETQTHSFRVNNTLMNKIITQTSTPVIKGGEIIKILSVARDVTHEENLKLKLVDKICQINTLMEHIPMLVYMKDKNFNFITGSKGAREFVKNGFDPFEKNLQLDVEKMFCETETEDKKVVTEKTTIEKERNVPSVDGRQHWYRVHKAPILDVNNEGNGLVTIVKNIDREKTLEAQKELFLATLTHDLKNPVQAQLMSLNMLNNGTFGELNPEQKEMLEMVIESANYMREMLNTILATYKYENGIITLNKESFLIEDLMEVCINEVKAFAANKNIEIIYENLTNNTLLFADQNQLRRVISNLINNALNYSFENTEFKINITCEDNIMKFIFENTSKEIPEDIKNSIFEKYVTGAEYYKVTGIGLGLYFSKKVVDSHNGRIYLETEGNHNKFIFEIPLTDSQAKASIAW